MKEVGRLERHFWSFLESAALVVVIPFAISKILNEIFGWNEVMTMFLSAVVLWVVYREIIIRDLRRKKK